MSEKLILIDGHSILNRAFYGVPDLSNADGLHTNAVYGFLNIMFKIMEEEQPQYLAVAFDVHAPTFRHQIYEAYKGTRKPMPEELREQVPVMKEVLRAMGILVVEKAGLEADDILGTWARRAQKDKMEVALISGDRDLLQIASDHIRVRIPKTRGGRTEIENYYAADVKEKYQVTPVQFIDLKALMGDSSDNIPGVPRIGEKTATELMVKFGSLDGIYEHLEELTKKAVKESLRANRALADLSKVLATIDTDADIEYDPEMARIGMLYTKDAYTLFKKLEFKNMLSRFTDDKLTQNNQTDFFRWCTLPAEADDVFAKAKAAGKAGFCVIEDSAEEKDFAAVSLAISEKEVYVLKAEGLLNRGYLMQKLKELAAAGIRLSTFDIKNQYRYLEREDTGTLFDVLIAAWLLNPLKNDYAVEDIAGEYLGLVIPGKIQSFEKRSFKMAMLEKEQEFLEYAGFLSLVCLQAEPVLVGKLEQTGMFPLFTEMEMPLSRVLYEMEEEGIQVLPDELKAYGEALTGQIKKLEQAIHESAGVDFNINSPKQLGEVLFDRLKLPGSKKIKSGYSTAADVLEKLAPDYRIVADILEYRGLTKLKSTYAEGLSNYIGTDSRIHSRFNQTITATGRISSTEPNLQNIPMRMELGRLIRKVFVPKDGFIFMDADYSQIELRVLAHLSGDEQLIGAYRMDEDIHRITASKVFHTPFEEVTDLQRRNAKAVNFGIVYGISSFGLSQDLSIARKEAAAYIEQYFETYPDVKNFLDREVASAKENGYVTTMFGRRRPVPELKSSNFMQRSFGERVAMNSPIQGTAADIIKVAMIRVSEELKRLKLRSRLILQVHDELLLETARDEEAQVREILETQMKSAAELDVSLEIDLHTGENWYEAK